MNAAAVKLTTYFNERDRVGERFLADVLFDVYERHQMRTSVLLRGVQGFGLRHTLHTDRLLSLSESLPAVSVAVDATERVIGAVPEIVRVARNGLISLERARLLTGPDLDHIELPSETVKLTVYGGRAIRSDGQTGYVAAIDELQRAGASGAVVFLAVDGTLHGQRQRARFFARNANVPLMLLAVGQRRALTEALPTVARLIGEPVVTVERVQILKSAGAHVAHSSPVPERDGSGLPILQKLMIHCEEQAHWHGRPLYVELVRRLREARAAGVTVLRGVRGFYGDHEPFAERLLSLRRNVPVLVVAIDSPRSVERWWPVVDELTSESGLVTSELVPASHAWTTGSPPDLSLAETPTIDADEN